MKSLATGTTSGCIVWLLVFGALAITLCPLAAAAAAITSTVADDFVAGVTGPMLCPPDTTPVVETYETTMTDSDGFESPATGYSMECLNAAGEVVATPGPMYGFLWVGILGVGSLVLSALLALLLAAPAGVLIARITGRGPKPAPPLPS
jgi:hypothetical protein